MQIDPYRRLWLAVLEKAYDDATTKKKSLTARNYQKKAMGWLFSDPKFLRVCEYAGVSPGRIRNLVKLQLEERGQV